MGKLKAELQMSKLQTQHASLWLAENGACKLYESLCHIAGRNFYDDVALAEEMVDSQDIQRK